MNKNLKIFLAVLALISVCLSISVIFNWNPFIKKEADLSQISLKNKSDGPSPTPEFTIKSVVGFVPEETAFKLPVDIKYLYKSFPTDSKTIFLNFKLEPGTEIRPIFSGEVLTSVVRPERDSMAGKDPEANIIWVKNNEKGLRAEYFFIGEKLVEEGDIITDDTVLGRVKEGALLSRGGNNFSLMVVNEKGEMIELSKDLFLR